jgi:Na+-driven multidrug efflux pump
MWAMVITGSMNILGDAALISGRWGFPALGAEGAAWASLFAESTGLTVLVGNVLWRHGRELMESAWMKMDALRNWIRLALPMILQLTLTLGTWSMFFFLVEQVGVMELKVSHIARNFFMLAFVVSQGVQQTTRTFISGLLGEGRGAELIPVMRKLFVVNACGILLMSHGGVLYPALLASPFFADPIGLEAAVKTLPVIFSAMMMYSFSSVLLSSVQGSGNTAAALVIEISALVFYTATSVLFTLVYPQPVWRIWWVEWVYFSLMGAGCLVFLTRWDWRSKKV